LSNVGPVAVTDFVKTVKFLDIYICCFITFYWFYLLWESACLTALYLLLVTTVMVVYSDSDFL